MSAAPDVLAPAWPEPHRGRDIVLSARNASVSFAVHWLRQLVVRGVFHEVSGAIRVSSGDLARSTVRVEVPIASLRTGIALRDRHLRAPLFFDAARHPTASFGADGAVWQGAKLRLSGSLTIRGTTRRADAVCTPLWNERGSRMAALSVVGAMTLDRLDYGVGAAVGLHRSDPLLRVIGTRVEVRVVVNVGDDA